MTFSHETCTFCPGGDVDIADWTRSRSPYLGDEVLSVGGYVRGFVAAARNYHGVELVGLESPAGVYGGSSRSWSTENAFNHFLSPRCGQEMHIVAFIIQPDVIDRILTHRTAAARRRSRAPPRRARRVRATGLSA